MTTYPLDAHPAGLAPVKARFPIGIMPNAAHQGPDSVFLFPGYSLAIVEFDDQGRCYDRRQMDALTEKLEQLSSADAVILVFVHGWKHDARSNDKNLMKFLSVVARMAAEEGPRGAPVLGVFVGWRGLSLYGLRVIENVTLWDRKQAGLRVAMGAPRELFGRLRQFRQARLDARGAPLLVIIGHSFGGLIVFSALAQSLIEAAATQAGALVPSFADLVLLVNPAFEGVRYLPIHDLVKARDEGSFAQNQRPVFVSVTAHNDWATGILFPLGMAIVRIEEKTKGTEEKQALIHTMGHLPWMRTHELSVQRPLREDNNNPGHIRLERVQFAETNPFWVVGATPNVINGHNGIWQQPFIDFVEGLVVESLRAAKIKRYQLSSSGEQTIPGPSNAGVTAEPAPPKFP